MSLKGETFFDLIDSLIGTKDAKIMKAFKEILKQVNPDTQEWFNHQSNRDKIKESVSIAEPTLNTYIARFAKSKLLIKQAPRGLYKLNDKYLELM